MSGMPSPLTSPTMRGVWSTDQPWFDPKSPIARYTFPNGSPPWVAGGIGEAADVDALFPPRIIAGPQGDQVGVGGRRIGRESLWADHDPVAAKPQDRGEIVAGAGFNDLEPVIRCPALQAAEIAIEI